MIVKLVEVFENKKFTQESKKYAMREVFVNPEPGNEEHAQLVDRYAKLVGKQQTVVDRENGYDSLMDSGV